MGMCGVYGGIQGCMEVYGGIWRWRHIGVYGGVLGYMEAYRGLWRWLRMDDGVVWWCMVLFRKKINTFLLTR